MSLGGRDVGAIQEGGEEQFLERHNKVVKLAGLEDSLGESRMSLQIRKGEQLSPFKERKKEKGSEGGRVSTRGKGGEGRGRGGRTGGAGGRGG